MSILLSEILSHNPVQKLEINYKERMNKELQTLSEIIFLYCEQNYLVKSNFSEVEEFLRSILFDVKSRILSSLGKLSNKEKYIYLLQVNEWINDLLSRKQTLQDDRWEIDHKNEKAVMSFNSNQIIIKEGFSSIYDSLTTELTDFHKDLIEKFTNGILTDQSPKEVAEIIITQKPQFVLSKDLMLQTILGKEKTTVLDKYQTALLFTLLMEKNAILDLNYTSLANILCRLTPHSEKVLAKDMLPFVKQIRQDHEGFKNKTINEPNHNLLTVKGLLQEIIDDLDAQIEINLAKK